MTRDELIETMARAIWEYADDEVGWEATLSLARTGDVYMNGQVDFVRLQASSALTAIEAAGYAVVPRNPTVEMRVAGGQMMVNVYSGGVYSYGRVPANDGQPGDVGTIYRAMIAAATEK